MIPNGIGSAIKETPEQAERHNLEDEIYRHLKNIGSPAQEISIDKLRRIAAILREG